MSVVLLSSAPSVAIPAGLQMVGSVVGRLLFTPVSIVIHYVVTRVEKDVEISAVRLRICVREFVRLRHALLGPLPLSG